MEDEGAAQCTEGLVVTRERRMHNRTKTGKACFRRTRAGPPVRVSLSPEPATRQKYRNIAVPAWFGCTEG